MISNAIKYSNNGGIINIKSLKKNGKIYFEINDNGIGIPKKEQLKVFERFFRASNSYLKASVGSGLGLTTVKKIIEGHKGKIAFKSTENKGSTFYFTLPL